MFNPSRDDYDEIAYRELCPQGAALMDGRLSSCIDYEDPDYAGEYWPNKMASLPSRTRHRNRQGTADTAHACHKINACGIPRTRSHQRQSCSSACGLPHAGHGTTAVTVLPDA